MLDSNHSDQLINVKIMDAYDYKRIEKAIIYLEEHALEQPSLDEVAHHVNLSSSHFQRVFKAWAGVTPKRFLQFLTIEHAKKMLHKSASVLDAAIEVGLSGPSRLHDLFVSVEAMTPGEFKHKGKDLEVSYGFHPTPFGECLLGITPRGICHLGFVDPENKSIAIDEFLDTWKKAILIEKPDAGKKVLDQIFSRGNKQEHGPVKILLKGTNFQIKVWEALLRIPEGTVVTYGLIANAIGHPSAPRAVGNAVGHNPIAYLIPCHRVLRENGGISGYHWGTARKKAILARESALCEKESLLGKG